MDDFKVRNWDKWQSYRSDRGQPPWIKVHRCVMRNPEWVSLTDAERGQLVAIWLLAADRNGVIPASPELIQKLCYMDGVPDLCKFNDLGFIETNGCLCDANTTPTRRQHDQPEAETDKKQISPPNPPKGGMVKYTDDFLEFWKHYPKKVGKGAAYKSWKKIKSPKETLAKILIALVWQKKSENWTKENGQFIPHPQTYLNQSRWEDEEYKKPEQRRVGVRFDG